MILINLNLMKKIVFLFAMMLMSISGFAQADQIVNSYKDKTGVQIIELNKGMLDMMASQAKTDEEKEALKSVESMTMGMIGSDEMAKEITGKLGALEGQGYSKMDVKEESVKATVYLKQADNIITEIVMVATAQGHNILTLMKGKFNADQMESLIKK